MEMSRGAESKRDVSICKQHSPWYFVSLPNAAFATKYD